METIICKYISFNEATKSHTAIRLGIDNTPNEEELKRMQLVGTKVFDPLREHIGHPIKVEAFFRCKELNDTIGGASPNSQHIYGYAIDIDDDFGNTTNSYMFYWLVNNVEFDQIIWEFGDGENPGWIHVSYVENANRKRITLAYKNKENKSVYEHFKTIEEFDSRKKEIYLK